MYRNLKYFSLLRRMSLPTTFNEPVALGVIGGTGLYQLDGFEPVAKLSIDTPWGKPSSEITICRTEKGLPIAFLSRHGIHHQYTPSTVPTRANIGALKKIGVRVIIAFSAVGSLQQHLKPRDFIVPTQIIDRTKGVRPSSYFDQGFVGHVGFGDPFDKDLGKLVEKFGGERKGVDGKSIHIHTKATEGKDLTLICMEGPAFSTRAESTLYRSWGGSVINMSALPEAKLAKEAEIAYQMICMSTDYDAWREEAEPVTVETVVGNLKANSGNAHLLLHDLLVELEEQLQQKKIGYALEGTMKYALSTGPAGFDREVKDKVDWLLPHWSS